MDIPFLDNIAGPLVLHEISKSRELAPILAAIIGWLEDEHMNVLSEDRVTKS